MNETFKIGQMTVTIKQDEDAENPREWCNAGRMVCFHPDYYLGDTGGNRRKDGEHGSGETFATPEEFQEWWKENGKGGICLPLYLYDHSGLTMNTTGFSCPWDSGQVGWIYATRETILKEWGKGNRVTAKTMELGRKYLVSEVETYDQYLRGDVYGFIVEDEDGNHLDSCWGFFGFDYCIQEATEAAEHAAKNYANEACLV